MTDSAPAQPRWRTLLQSPDSIEAAGIGTSIIADGGETAYRASLTRWNELRHSDNRDANAGIALILADAFDDERALKQIADEWPEIFPEEIAWRCAIREPGPLVRRVFGAKALEHLQAWSEHGTVGDLPREAAAAARILYPNDHGETYLQTRRLLLERAHKSIVQLDAGSTDAAERVADDLLVAAAAGNSENVAVQQTVLSYWGEAQPLDSVPTAEPMPGALPASWHASCELLARCRVQPIDELLADLMGDTDEVESGGREAVDYVRALGCSEFIDADSRLLEFAKSDNPVAGQAVRELASRRRRIAGAPPAYLDRVDTLIDGLLEHGLLHETPGHLTREALAKQVTDDASPLETSVSITDAFGGVPAAGDSWQRYSDWLDEAEIPGPAAVPAPRQPRRRGFGRLFG